MTTSADIDAKACGERKALMLRMNAALEQAKADHDHAAGCHANLARWRDAHHHRGRALHRASALFGVLQAGAARGARFPRGSARALRDPGGSPLGRCAPQPFAHARLLGRRGAI